MRPLPPILVLLALLLAPVAALTARVEVAARTGPAGPELASLVGSGRWTELEPLAARGASITPSMRALSIPSSARFAEMPDPDGEQACLSGGSCIACARFEGRARGAPCQAHPGVRFRPLRI